MTRDQATVIHQFTKNKVIQSGAQLVIGSPGNAADPDPTLAGRGVFTASEVSCGTSKTLVAGYRDFLIRHGARKGDDIRDADIILVDTCAFAASAESRSLANIVHD